MTDRTCVIEGCDKIRRYAPGWCPMHYQRWTTRGTFAKSPPKVRDLCKCGEPVRARGMCRKCYRADYLLRNREHEYATAKQYYAEHAPELRAQNMAYYYANTERFAAKYQANKDAIRKRARELAKDPARQARRRKTEKAWRLKNYDAWTIRNRENTRRRQTNGELVDYTAILAEFGMVCHICTGEIESRSDLHMDHVIPLARGGLHVADNIRPSHALCNLRKGAKIA